jgi:cyclopropane fatty-acyl-phospholipid synthase-like methyltransferase
MSANEIYAAIRGCKMVDWVDADPAVKGAQNFASVIENLSLQANHAVLDFGCGIGHTSAPLGNR